MPARPRGRGRGRGHGQGRLTRTSTTSQVGQKRAAMPAPTLAQANKVGEQAAKRARSLVAQGSIPIVVQRPPKGMVFELRPARSSDRRSAFEGIVEAGVDAEDDADDDAAQEEETESTLAPSLDAGGHPAPRAGVSTTGLQGTADAAAAAAVAAVAAAAATAAAGRLAHPGMIQGEYIPTSPIARDILVADHVPQALRLKIWQGAYVDFALLLPGSIPGRIEGEVSIMPPVDDASEEVVWKRTRVTRHIDTILKWNEAWAAFSVLYLMANPGSAAELIQYGSFIAFNTYDKSFANAYDYDVAYRHFRIKDPLSSWAEIHQGLFSKYIMRACSLPTAPSYAKNAVSNKFGGPKAKQVNPFPCFDYNGAGCNRAPGVCKYTHKCTKCQKPGHPAPKCYGGGAGAKKKASGRSQYPSQPVLPPLAAHQVSK